LRAKFASVNAALNYLFGFALGSSVELAAESLVHIAVTAGAAVIT
jgi:hypothetical protein